MTQELTTLHDNGDYRSLTHNDYLPLSARTLGDPWHSDKQIVRFLCHASLGLNSEQNELITAWKHIKQAPLYADGETKRGRCINFIEECGDKYWYLAILFREFFGTLTTYELQKALEDASFLTIRCFKNMKFEPMLEIISSAEGEIANQAKRALFYNSQIDAVKIMTSVFVVSHVLREMLISEIIGSSPMDARARNINKLKKRFKDKFSEIEANNRNLDAEYEALQKGITNV